LDRSKYFILYSWGLGIYWNYII